MIKKKAIYIVLAIFMILAIIATTLILCAPRENEIDIVACNRLAGEIGNNWDKVTEGNFAIDSVYPYCVISLNGITLIGEKIGNSYNESINRAVKLGYPTFDILNNDEIVGKLIVLIDYNGFVKTERVSTIIAVAVFYFCLISIVVVYMLYLELIIFRPFKKMSDYASFIGTVNLIFRLRWIEGIYLERILKALILCGYSLKLPRRQRIKHARIKRTLYLKSITICCLR